MCCNFQCSSCVVLFAVNIVSASLFMVLFDGPLFYLNLPVWGVLNGGLYVALASGCFPIGETCLIAVMSSVVNSTFFSAALLQWHRLHNLNNEIMLASLASLQVLSQFGHVLLVAFVAKSERQRESWSVKKIDLLHFMFFFAALAALGVTCDAVQALPSLEGISANALIAGTALCFSLQLLIVISCIAQLDSLLLIPMLLPPLVMPLVGFGAYGWMAAYKEGGYENHLEYNELLFGTVIQMFVMTVSMFSTSYKRAEIARQSSVANYMAAGEELDDFTLDPGLDDDTFL